MSFIDRLRRWLEVPEPEVRFECGNCGHEVTKEADTCPECGGQLEVQSSVPEYGYWGPM